MSTDLSILADRLRDFITICSDEPESFSPPRGSSLARHYDIEFNAMALVLFARQFTHNKAYRAFCESRNVRPGSISSWTEIPAVPTSAFKDLEMTCLAPENRTTVFHSSGTTQQRPSRHFHSAESLALYEHSLWPWFQIHVLAADPPSSILNSQSLVTRFRPLILTPPADQAPHSSLVYMFDVVRARLRAPADSFVARTTADGSWVLDLAAAVDFLRDASQTEPVLVLGTAFSIVHLLDHLVESDTRVRLPRGSRLMVTGGYKGRSREVSRFDLHALITERLGIAPTEIIGEYGMSELSSQAYQFGANHEDPGKRPFRFPPWTRVQIVSPETGREVEEGETGLLRVADLANTFSVMAVQTEDLGIQRAEGFELIGRSSHAEPRGCSLMSESGI